MNYRHIFHAGNVCDVVKHTTFALAVASLRLRDKAFCVLDTHAGVGLYDLQDERAQKTGEAKAGIFRFLAAAPIPGLEDYDRILRETNAGDFRFYPGSPVIARRLLRPQDRLVLCELHDEDYAEAKKQFRNDKQVQIHHRDGYEALGAFLPPPEKRGLVFIDPPFEATDEFVLLAKALTLARARWPQGVFLAWYPIKERPAIWRFHEALMDSGMPKILCAEFVYRIEARADRLNGCGFIIINPPWKLDEKLNAVFPALHKAMETEHQETKIKWLAE
jgi:23S rRNA (adenine2030-N6)-methyltransferase